MLSQSTTDAADEAAWRCAGRPGGYAWWYVDIVGAGAAGTGPALSLILFAGAVFSPTYAARSRQGAGDSGLDHPAVHVALQVPGLGRAWVMNERPGSLRRRPGGVQVGPSHLTRQGDGSVSIELHEETTRFFGRPGPLLMGTIRLRPRLPPLAPEPLAPDGGDEHAWQPLALSAEAEVELRLGDRPIRFSGDAYHDMNYGAGRLERTFSRWSWAHGSAGGRSVVAYRVSWLAGGGRSVAVRQGPGQAARSRGGLGDAVDRPARGGGFLWLPVPRRFAAGDLLCERAADGCLLDAPFYARYRATITDQGEPGAARYEGVGEYLDLTRFRRPAVQFLLGYRTYRAEGGA